ncbi:MAG: hypothetical protein [Circular genetic element sp.]|nr:MAG: hypothetical protein [Circular genetic element sp.]
MSNRILSYRSLLADGGQDQILLTTKKGEVGYRIVKFQVMSKRPYDDQSAEHILKIYKEEQSSIDGVIDFSDNRLLGAGITNNDVSGYRYGSTTAIIFDQEIFNQDIYITHKDVIANTRSCNYYLELEIIKLDESQAMVATLKDIRNNS